jgi:serine/threonine protein kinase
MQNVTDVLNVLRQALPPEYDLVGPIGSGGQGSVFHARWRGQEVALKVFGPATETRRIDRELGLLRQIDCVNLVRVVSDGNILVSGTPTRFVAYEYLSGGSLRDRCLPGQPKLSFTELLAICSHCALAIEALWSKRVVHRDVKPDNIVFANLERYVLIDLGLARHLDRSNLTAPGLAPGTEGYKSPEQALGRRNLTIHSDVFSLGVTLYELACQTHPFNRSQPRAGSQSFTELEIHRPDLPGAFTSLIHRMMSFSPAGRPNYLTATIRAIPGGSDVLP